MAQSTVIRAAKPGDSVEIMRLIVVSLIKYNCFISKDTNILFSK